MISSFLSSLNSFHSSPWEIFAAFFFFFRSSPPLIHLLRWIFSRLRHFHFISAEYFITLLRFELLRDIYFRAFRFSSFFDDCHCAGFHSFRVTPPQRCLFADFRDIPLSSDISLFFSGQLFLRRFRQLFFLCFSAALFSSLHYSFSLYFFIKIGIFIKYSAEICFSLPMHSLFSSFYLGSFILDARVLSLSRALIQCLSAGQNISSFMPLAGIGEQEVIYEARVSVMLMASLPSFSFLSHFLRHFRE